LEAERLHDEGGVEERAEAEQGHDAADDEDDPSRVHETSLAPSSRKGEYSRVSGEGSWRWVGDRALLRAFPEIPLADANAAARRLHAELRERSLPEIEALVPGARSLLVVLRHGREPSGALCDALERPPRGAAAGEEAPPLHRI